MNEINFIRSFLKKKILTQKLINTTDQKTKRNLLTYRLRKAKIDYYNDFFEANKNKDLERYKELN